MLHCGSVETLFCATVYLYTDGTTIKLTRLDLFKAWSLTLFSVLWILESPLIETCSRAKDEWLFLLLGLRVWGGENMRLGWTEDGRKTCDGEIMVSISGVQSYTDDFVNVTEWPSCSSFMTDVVRHTVKKVIVAWHWGTTFKPRYCTCPSRRQLKHHTIMFCKISICHWILKWSAPIQYNKSIHIHNQSLSQYLSIYFPNYWSHTGSPWVRNPMEGVWGRVHNGHLWLSSVFLAQGSDSPPPGWTSEIFHWPVAWAGLLTY